MDPSDDLAAFKAEIQALEGKAVEGEAGVCVRACVYACVCMHVCVCACVYIGQLFYKHLLGGPAVQLCSV